MKHVMPVCGGSAAGSVFTSVATTPERRPFVTHIFWPLMSQSSPSRTAVERIACTSEPQWGSVIEKAPRTSPVAICGSRRSRCSSVPLCSSIDEQMKCVLMMPETDIQPREISSIARQYVVRSSPCRRTARGS